MAEIKLKPCPFCGGEAELEKRGMFEMTVFDVKCMDCRAIGCGGNTAEKAVAAWNKRASDWIPCSGRKPKARTDVLLQFDKNMCVGFYSQDWWNVNTGNGLYTAILQSEDQPIAWMPLPEEVQQYDA